jgi:N-succinyldiaminopimelate aminotransferase
VNPDLSRLQPYPFEKLTGLLSGVVPNTRYKPIPLQIGEPKHPTPEFIRQAVSDNLVGLAAYPATAGMPALRQAIARWLMKRYHLPAVNADTQVLPVNGSREALFAFAQTVIDRNRASTAGAPIVVCPNPFYQIYEGAAILAGAEPYYVNADSGNGFSTDFRSIPEGIWKRTQLLYVCSPGNPTGRVMTLDEWKEVFALADRYEFCIASDECYSELYFDEDRAPIGALQAAHQLGRTDFRHILVFSSLSKRSNVPGMRSGFVAGDSQLIKPFLLYRTYHGSAMAPVVQSASIAAWQDETHVVENRRLYVEKYRAVLPLLQPVLETAMPDGGFYLWAKTPRDDAGFARELLQAYNVTVLPGSFLAREAHGVNPGSGYIRIALVASLAECVEAAHRIVEFVRKH